MSQQPNETAEKPKLEKIYIENTEKAAFLKAFSVNVSVIRVVRVQKNHLRNNL
jgi:hypothetical protein